MVKLMTSAAQDTEALTLAAKERLQRVRIAARLVLRIPLYSLSSVAAVVPGGSLPLMEPKKAIWFLEYWPKPDQMKRIYLEPASTSEDGKLRLRITTTTLHEVKK